MVASQDLLCLLNVIDFAVAGAAVGASVYTIWLGTGPKNVPPLVYVPILLVLGCLALSSVLNWFTVSCRAANCMWLISISIIVDLLVSGGAAALGVLLLTDFGKVDECVSATQQPARTALRYSYLPRCVGVQDVELSPEGSVTGTACDASLACQHFIHQPARTCLFRLPTARRHREGSERSQNCADYWVFLICGTPTVARVPLLHSQKPPAPASTAGAQLVGVSRCPVVTLLCAGCLLPGTCQLKIRF